jgi:hypothetical protein
MTRLFRLTLLSLSLGWTGLQVASAAALYSTSFDQGYTNSYELAGQAGWIKDTASTGGNGLILNFNGSQAAYVGLFDLQPADDFISLWRPINHTPVLAQAPVVKFSVDLTIVDSTGTNNNRDDFFWSIYNMQGDRFFTVDFDNKDLGIYYVLDGTNDWVYSRTDFENDVTYKLQVTLDFARNRWSAALAGTNILKDLPITTTGAPLTLGDVDAVWAVFTRDKPGDNFMVFDNYQVVTEALVAQASVRAPGQLTNSTFPLRVFGQSGSSYAVETSTNLLNWIPRKTNIVIDTSFDYTDPVPGPQARRFYRARLVP